jgi:hypothetical protein
MTAKESRPTFQLSLSPNMLAMNEIAIDTRLDSMFPARDSLKS